MRKQVFGFILVLASAISTQAQYLVPLTSAPDRRVQDKKFAAFRESNLPLSLPFFDDFAESDVQLSPLRWEQASGAFLNNQFAVGQPSKNVVTFDGLKADGKAYNINQVIQTYYTDTLTSKAIDLSSYAEADSVFLSFAWQAGGLGDSPSVNNSYLVVEFKRGNGAWISINESQILSDGTPGFQFKVIDLADASIGTGNLSLFHFQFQFRFRSFGYQAGMGDIWNLDYVYLNTGRSHNDTVFYDVATTTPPTSILAPFSAVPIQQYLANPSAFTSDTIVQEGVNLHDVFRIVQFKNELKNREENISVTLKDAINIFEAFSRDTLLNTNTQNSVIGQTNDQRHLDYQFHLVSPAVDPEPYEFRLNDTIRRSHNLSNYFAYDDGTAESAYLLLNGDQAAIRFDLQVPAYIGGVDMYFTPFRDNVEGNVIRVKGWKVGADGKPDNSNVLFEKVVEISYEGLNNFVRVELDNPVQVTDAFFIGWRQTFGPRHVLGVDLNSNSSQFRYFGNLSNNSWTEDIVETGSLMVRPIMDTLLVAAPDPLAENFLQVHPNPSSGIFQLTGEFDTLELFDSNGRQIPVLQSQNGQLNLSSRPTGLYLLRAWRNGRVSTHKLVLTGK